MAVGGARASQAASTGRTGGGGSRPTNTADAAAKGGTEDLLKLPWAYGSGDSSSSSSSSSGSGGGGGGGGTGGLQKRSHRSDASAGPARGASGGDNKGNREGGGESAKAKVKVGEGALGKEAGPPKEAHPAGYTNGSVVVPAESKVFSQMPQRFPARADGSRTAEAAKKLADVQVRLGAWFTRSLVLGVAGRHPGGM